MASVTQLIHTNPEAEGIPSSAILDFVRAVEQHTHPLDAVQGFILLRHGNVAAEGWWKPYDPQYPHSLYSLSKSFTSTALGLAVAEGRLTVDDLVLKFFPEEAPSNPSENLKSMRVRHLLSMNTGHKEDTTRHVFRGEDDNWAHAFLTLPVEYQPGTWFVYNTAATYMLSAIITRLTGEPLLDYLRPRLFAPLGIENPVWDTDPRGINLGGTGLHIKTEDIARFGQMYLQRGIWQDQRIVPEEWVAEATKATSDNRNTQTNPDWTAGYGYQFWRCRHNAYRGDGAFGQFCIVMPEQDAVLTIISGVQDMQVVLNKVWKYLLPAMQTEALPADPQAYNELCDKLAVLSLPLADGQASSPTMKQWSGKSYKLENNHLQFESAVIQFSDKYNTLILRNERGEHPIQIGYSTWLERATNFRGCGDEPIAASGAWTTEDTYEVRVCCTEDAYCPVFRFHYTSDELQLEVEPNATWDWEPAGVTKITGRVTGRA
ncbi:MAG TPA: serine hydrolase [Anaerolineales bacterium]|nr:serine hydrolase [Anaerolineales bacterium]